MVMTRAPEIRTLLRRWPRTLRVSTLPGGTTEYTSIAAAVAYADSQGGEWTLLCDSGTYNEGDITPNGGANITIRALGPGRVSIAPTVAPAAGVVVSGFTLRLEDVIVTAPDATMPALRVIGGTCTAVQSEVNGVGVGDAIQMVGGTLIVSESTIGAGDIDLSTAPCTLSMYRCRITTDPVDTTGAFAHVIVLNGVDLNGQNVASAATGATILTMDGCTNVGTITNAGTGAFTVRESYVASLNQTNATGTITVRGGTLLACAGATGSVVWWLNSYELKVIAGMRIQHAIDAASGGETILIGPGTFTESLVCDAADDVVTLRGMGRDKTIITQAAGNALTVTDCATVCVENLTLQVTAGAGHSACIANAATANAGISLRSVKVKLTGTLATANWAVFVIQAAALAASLDACDVEIAATNTEAGASATVGLYAWGRGTIVLRECELSANDTNGAASAIIIDQTTIESDRCSYTALGTTANTISLTSNAASILHSHNDAFNAGVISKGALGVMTCKSAPQQYEVWAGMSIGNAITAAAADTPAPAATAPYTVLIHPGVYNEVITMATWVHLKGVDREAVIIQQANATIVTLASNVTLDSLTVRLTAPTVTRMLVVDGGSLTGVVLRNIEFAVTTPGGWNIYVIYLNGGSTIRFESCRANISGGGVDSFIIGVLTNAATIRVVNCDFELTPGWDIAVNGVGIVVWVEGGRLAGIPVHAGIYSNGTIRIQNCQYRSVARGTGDIIDESPEAKDLVFHVVKMPLESLDNVATRTALGGAVTPGGSGQLRLRINDNAADEAGIENNTDPAGALDSSFTAGRSIRYVRQVSVNAFRATTDMFFGLRATLGGAVPGAAEDHFGFIWNGANFIASSSDGAGVGQTTHLTTPSVATQHQLEAIQLWTQVEFYVDGVLVATHANAAGIPTAGGTLDFQDWEESDGLGGATTSDVTLRNGFIQECPA